MSRRSNTGTQPAQCPPMHTLYVTGHVGDKETFHVVHGCRDVDQSWHQMYKAHEFWAAAPRLGKRYVCTMVNPWQAWVMRVILRIEL